MNFSSLSRSSPFFSGRAFLLRPQLVRFKSTATKSVPFPSSPLKLEVAVTPKKVTLKFAEYSNIPVTPRVIKAASITKDLNDSTEMKTNKRPDTTKTKATKTTATKAAGPDKESEGASAVSLLKASKPGKKQSPSSVQSKVLECWVDASPTHIGIVIGNRYKIFALKDGWMTKTRDVNWAETAAFELAVQYLTQQGYVGRAQIKSDSYTALLAISGGKVRVPEIMESARRTGDALKISSFAVETVKVPRKANIADRFASGKTMEGYEELQGDITIPEALAPFVKAL
ncbi:unnamed protein product [Rhizoctonia solani]|uniref:Uncharacterized protein n=1 Tax=Rhizoctonia solani TaxID=456999 RepID=A0A8H3DJ68_9AGAM|nr:unnamed protein product [Rhizoctonia solani]